MRTTRNYNEHGGDVTVIDGKLIISGTLEVKDGATVTGIQAGGASTVTSENITDATQIGKALLTAANKTVVQQTVSPNADVVAFLSGTLEDTNKNNVRTLINAKSGDYVPSWGEITGKPSTFAPVEATTDVIGGVKKMGRVADSTAEDVATLVADFNALLTKLKLAGMME